MIEYNLRVMSYSNHPMDYKYGVLLKGSYRGYPVTIVDNHYEVVNGRYTDTPTKCLIHLSEDVRVYADLRLSQDFLYLEFCFGAPTYRMFEYKKTELTDDEVIKILKRVFYKINPELQSHSLVGWSSEKFEDDPNYYEGHYVLNDEEEYTILKCKDTYRFYKGAKSYYPNWARGDEFIYEGIVDFDLYKKAIEVYDLRCNIVNNINAILDKHADFSIEKYHREEEILNKMLETLK